MRGVVATYWPEQTERITGVTEAQLGTAAQMLGGARRPMVLTARGPEQQAQGVTNTLAYINLALALGRHGEPCGRLRLPHGTGERAGWARARPEGRPTPRLSQDR